MEDGTAIIGEGRKMRSVAFSGRLRTLKENFIVHSLADDQLAFVDQIKTLMDSWL